MRGVGKLLCAVVALVLVLWLGVFARTQFRHLRVSKTTRSTFAGRRANIYTAENKARKVYPLSVVPGGVYSSEELARSRRIDPVVAQHYAGFGNSVSVQKTVQDNYMYVSYRKEDKVYWTKIKHRIPRGEYVVTDGKSFARARCGNRLSPIPQEPVMNAGEPGDDRLDKPEPPGDMYLASVEPAQSDPLFSIPPSTGEAPMLDALSSAPKLAGSPRSAFAGDSPSSLFPGRGGFVGGPLYPLQQNRIASGSSASPSVGTPLLGTSSSLTRQPVVPSVPLSNLAEGGTVAELASIPTSEPPGLELLTAGGASLLLCLRVLRRVR